MYDRCRADAMRRRLVTDPRVLMERDDATGIARITFNDPERKNCYDPPMRAQLGEYLDELAMDDHVKVVVLRGEGGVFSTGADMGNAYGWYGSSNGRWQQRHAPAAEPASTTRSRSEDVLLLPRVHGLPEGDRCRSARLRARRRFGARAHGRHRGRRARRADRHARDALPRALRSGRCTCSSTGSARCSPAGSC